MNNITVAVIGVGTKTKSILNIPKEHPNIEMLYHIPNTTEPGEISKEILSQTINDAFIHEEIPTYFKMLEQEPFMLEAVKALEFPEGKKFSCSGKHQYREVRTLVEHTCVITWVCQCGRKL